MIELNAWLGERLHDVPATLRQKVEDAVNAQRATCNVDHDIAPCTLHIAHLKNAAETLLRDVVDSGENADPIDLLASDALITFACEAQADLAPEGLAEIR